MREIVAGLRIQFRVLGALILREIGSRHGGDVSGSLWLLVEPIIITLVVIGIHVVSSGSFVLQTIPILLFIITGYVPHLMFRHCGLAGYTALHGSSGLLYHRRVHYLDIIFGRLAVEIVATFFGFILIASVSYAIGMVAAPRMLGYVYLGWFLHIWFAVSSCFLFSGLALKWELVRRMFMPLVLVMLPIYASFFMLAWLPENVRNFLLYFPSANATEIMRRGFLGYSYPTYFDIPYTIEVNIIYCFIGLCILQINRRQLEL